MKAIKKITALSLAMVFLLSSLGFTINKMVCFKSGKTKISLTQLKDCCPKKESTTPVVKAQCCDINNTSFHLNDFNSSSKKNIPAADDVVLTINKFAFIHTENNHLTAKKIVTSDPPPIYGRQLLSFISILTI